MKSIIKKKLDIVFQKYIRIRDSNSKGVCQCISCGKPIIYGSGQLHAGHYFPRQHMGTRWNEKNVNGQCSYCNHFLSGNQHGYLTGLIKKYGETVITELECAKSLVKKYSDFDGKLLIEYYSKKIKELEKEKSIINRII